MTLVVATAAGVGLLSAHDKVAANPKLAGGTGQNTVIANRGASSLPAGSGSSAASPSATRTAAAPAPSVTSTAPPARDVKRRIQLPARWTSPITGGIVTTCFCMRWGKFHDGIDLAAPLGTPIHAPGDGVVVKVGPEEGYGETIFIRHANGDVSFYGHMARVFVHVGEKVKTGQVIAPVGNEGFSTGPHLHFTIHRGGIDGPVIDPKPWLAARGVKVG
jgi:murein DD-endopeptidase MepM/ murein hydrolase activator NlpD